MKTRGPCNSSSWRNVIGPALAYLCLSCLLFLVLPAPPATSQTSCIACDGAGCAHDFGDSKRFAFLVGNNAYSGALAPLTKAIEDAETLRGILVDLEFNVACYKDLNHANFKIALKAFTDHVKRFAAKDPSTVSTMSILPVIYFAGHGVYHADDQFLMMSGSYADPCAVLESSDTVHSLRTVLRSITDSTLRPNSKRVAPILILDACRQKLTCSAKGEQQEFDEGAFAASHPYVVFTTRPNATADDGAFMAAFKEVARDWGKTFSEVVIATNSLLQPSGQIVTSSITYHLAATHTLHSLLRRPQECSSLFDTIGQKFKLGVCDSGIPLLGMPVPLVTAQSPAT